MYLTAKPINLFQPSVNIGHVSEYLSDSNRDLSENATKCKDFIQMHMSSNKAAGPPNMAALMSFINGKVEDKFSEIDAAASVNDENTVPKRDENGASEERKSEGNVTGVGSLPVGLESSIDLVRMYFDSKFHDIEAKLMKRMDDGFRELERKQDEKFQQILLMLQK